MKKVKKGYISSNNAILKIVIVSFFIVFNDLTAQRIYRHQLEYFEAVADRHLISADMDGCHETAIDTSLDHASYIPIFVLTKDRVTTLRLTLESYQRTIASPYRVILLDHNSTFPPMLEFLKNIPKEYNVESVHSLTRHASVTWKRPKYWVRTIEEAADFIEGYLQDNPEIDHYVFTDPDISFLHTMPDALLFFRAILQACPDISVVGPLLHTSDIPVSYNGRGKVLEVTAQFWERQKPNSATWKGRRYLFTEGTIDTTFSMRRRSTRFERLQKNTTVITFAPYSATHLPYYFTEKKFFDAYVVKFNESDIKKEKEWYLSHQRKVSHW